MGYVILPPWTSFASSKTHNFVERVMNSRGLTGGSPDENILTDLWNRLALLSVRPNYIFFLWFTWWKCYGAHFNNVSSFTSNQRTAGGLTCHSSSAPPRQTAWTWGCPPWPGPHDTASTFPRKSGELYFSVLLRFTSSCVDPMLMYLNQMRCDFFFFQWTQCVFCF